MPPKENPERACEECIHFFACSRQCGEPMAQRSATGCECYETVKSSMAYYVGTLDVEPKEKFQIASASWPRPTRTGGASCCHARWVIQCGE